MTHEEKIYEYARRISYYSQLASKERKESKVFKCSNLLRNLDIFRNLDVHGKLCGCFSKEIILYSARAKGIKEVDTSPCEQCKKAHVHYLAYREAKSKQGAAMRQLANEMNKNGKYTQEKDIK